MSKSEGGLYTLKELEAKGIRPLAYRFYCLLAHYRSEIAFDLEEVRKAQASLDRLNETIWRLQAVKESTRAEPFAVFPPYRKKFWQAMFDDLDTPKALSVLFELARVLNARLDQGPLSKKEAEDVLGFWKEADKVLGVFTFRQPSVTLSSDIQALVQKRESLRKEKKFKEADAIRLELQAKGFQLLDTPQGVQVRQA